MIEVPVVVLNWNGIDDTISCVHALLRQEDVRPLVHIVDNGSANGEADRLAREFGDRVQLHRSATNLGFTGGNNLALRALVDEPFEYVVLANNDTEPEPGWLRALVDEAERDPSVGLVQTPMVFHHDPGVIENAGVELMASFDAIPRGRGEPSVSYSEPAELLAVCAGGALYRTAMLRECGVLRDDFFANYEDIELSLRAVARGWRCRLTTAAVTRHKLNASIAKVRDFEFEVRSLRNAMVAFLANLPWQVVLLNMPWVLLRDVAMITLAPFTGRGKLARALLVSRWRVVRELGDLRRRRAELRPSRRGGWWRIWRGQRSPLQFSPRLLWQLLCGRR